MGQLHFLGQSESAFSHFGAMSDQQLLVGDSTDRSMTEGNRKKAVECQYCLKRFWNKADCQGHINTQHLKLKPFICRKCSVSFSYKQSLKSHELLCQADLLCSSNGRPSQNVTWEKYIVARQSVFCVCVFLFSPSVHLSLLQCFCLHNMNFNLESIANVLII